MMTAFEWTARCARAERQIARARAARNISPGWAHEAAEAALLLAAAAHASGTVSEREAWLQEATHWFERLIAAEQADPQGEATVPVLDVEVISRAILTAWAAGEFARAAAFGRLPAPLFRPAQPRHPDPEARATAFALASAARDDQAAFARALANARTAIARGKNVEPTAARGYRAPLLDGLEAGFRQQPRQLERALERLLRFHRWDTRTAAMPLAALDLTSSGLVRWADQHGVLLTRSDPLLALPSAEARR
ncbi:MAG: hypothetical protein K6U89_15330 [Chloroflexi bacterium]|nr:hypothetical protein [Chloroflexota bacterium]